MTQSGEGKGARHGTKSLQVYRNKPTEPSYIKLVEKRLENLLVKLNCRGFALWEPERDAFIWYSFKLKGFLLVRIPESCISHDMLGERGYFSFDYGVFALRKVPESELKAQVRDNLSMAVELFEKVRSGDFYLLSSEQLSALYPKRYKKSDLKTAIVHRKRAKIFTLDGKFREFYGYIDIYGSRVFTYWIENR